MLRDSDYSLCSFLNIFDTFVVVNLVEAPTALPTFHVSFSVRLGDVYLWWEKIIN